MGAMIENGMTEPDWSRKPGSRGDQAFIDFYRAEQPEQVRRAALMLGSDDAANDVVHDALTAMYRSWSSINEPGPYLNRAVLNGCRAVGRDRTRQIRLRERLQSPEASTTQDEVLLDVVGRLPFNQRAAVILRFYAQMSEREIADALGVPTGSVGPWIHRALSQMKKELS